MRFDFVLQICTQINQDGRLHVGICMCSRWRAVCTENTMECIASGCLYVRIQMIALGHQFGGSNVRALLHVLRSTVSFRRSHCAFYKCFITNAIWINFSRSGSVWLDVLVFFLGVRALGGSHGVFWREVRGSISLGVSQGGRVHVKIRAALSVRPIAKRPVSCGIIYFLFGEGSFVC